jgi:hypothetical protein
MALLPLPFSNLHAIYDFFKRYPIKRILFKFTVALNNASKTGAAKELRFMKQTLLFQTDIDFISYALLSSVAFTGSRMLALGQIFNARC